MGNMGKSKKLPGLRQYLNDQLAKPPRSEDAYLAVGGCLFTPLGTAASFIFLNRIEGLLVGLLVSVLLVMPALFALSYMIAQRLSRPRNEKEIAHLARFNVAKSWSNSAEKGKLHRELDPVAGQLLEAGTYYWKNIQDTLASPGWTRADLPGHWKSLREQALAASQAAMDDLFMLLKDCLGKPKKSRQDDVKEAFHSLSDLNILDAAQGLLMAATGDDTQYTFYSPVLPLVFEPAKELAEKLRDLSTEIDQMTRDVQTQISTGTQSLSSVGSIDLLLDEMRTIKQAEKELSDDEPPTHVTT